MKINKSIKYILILFVLLPIFLRAQLPVERINQSNSNSEKVTDKNKAINTEIINMVFVEGGSFQMGINDCDDYEKPVHQVTVSDFYIGKTEITQAQRNWL